MLSDFGRLVKPKTLVQAFMMCHHDHLDPDRWWRNVKKNHAHSKSFKKDMITGTYGMELNKLFSALDVDSYVGRIVSFLVVHRGAYLVVKSPDEVAALVSKGGRLTIIAAGLKFYTDLAAKPSDAWRGTSSDQFTWFFVPRQLVPLELVAQYNGAAPGDLVMYSKSHGVVKEVTTTKRTKFWATCSWTRRTVMVLSGQGAKPTKLSVDRPYRLVAASTGSHQHEETTDQVSELPNSSSGSDSSS